MSTKRLFSPPVLRAALTVGIAALVVLGVLAFVAAPPPAPVESTAAPSSQPAPIDPPAPLPPESVDVDAVAAEAFGVDAPPTTVAPPVVDAPDEARGIGGITVDGDELATETAESPPYVPPPAIPSRQPLRPPTIVADTPDPALVALGDGTFALFSTNSGGIHVPVRTSTDLATWSAPRDALAALPSWGRGGVTWAPSVVEHRGTWYLAVAVRSRSAPRHCIGLFTATSVTGRYRSTGAPVVCAGNGAIDPSLHSDGTTLTITWKAVTTGADQIRSATLDPATGRLSSPAVTLLTSTQAWEGYGIENPTFLDTGNRLLLFYSANWWTDHRYSTGFAECETTLGPCAKVTVNRPWLASSDGAVGPGGASFTRDRTGQWWMAYHAWVGGVGYGNGGYRPAHAEPIALVDDRPVLTNQAPFGVLEGWMRVPGGALVSGWAIDPDLRVPGRVSISLDGKRIGDTNAGWARPDIGVAHPRFGPNHGIVELVGMSPGAHTVCATARDDIGGPGTPIGCLDVTIDPTPFGAIDRFSVGPDGEVAFDGWVIDPDHAAAATIELHVDGVAVAQMLADGERPEVGARHPGYGDRHGFSWTGTVTGTTTSELCVVALDTTDGSPTALHCETHDIAPSTTTTTTTEPTTTTESTTTTTTTTEPTSTTTTDPTSTTDPTLPTSTTSSSTTTTTQPTTTTEPGSSTTTEPTSTTTTSSSTSSTTSTTSTTTTTVTVPG